MEKTYIITTAKTLPTFIFLKEGIAASTNEAMTIEVKITKIKSRRIQKKYTAIKIKTALINVPVDIEIEFVPFFSNILT